MSSCLIREVLKDRTSLLEAKKMNRGKYGDNEHTDICDRQYLMSALREFSTATRSN